MSDFAISQREVLYQGFFRMARYHLRFKLFDGGWSKTIVRELMERPSAVGVLPYDTIDDRVVLIEQFRPGAMAHTSKPWIFEVIAGIFSPDEAPDKVVIREAAEEAACEILDLYPICEYFVSPGGSDEYFHLFCGLIDTNFIDGIYGLDDEGENIRAFSLSMTEAQALLKQGKIQSSPAIIALQWLQLNHEWLRGLWQKKLEQQR